MGVYRWFDYGRGCYGLCCYHGGYVMGEPPNDRESFWFVYGVAHGFVVGIAMAGLLYAVLMK